MIVDGIFNIKGRGWVITGMWPLDIELPDLGQMVYNKWDKPIGTVRAIEMSIGNFGRREHIGIVLGGRLDRPILPGEGDTVTFDTVAE